MARIPSDTRRFYNTVRIDSGRAERAARSAGRRIDPDFIDASFRSATRPLVVQVTALQAHAATEAVFYSAGTLAQQGTWVAPSAWANPNAFAGWSPQGNRLTDWMDSARISMKARIAQGMPAIEAVRMGANQLMMIAALAVKDAARQAASVDIATRQSVGYVRMLNPPSCDRCVVLAGRFYRWNAGFLRHPNCDCVHVASTAGSTSGARAEGLVDDPYEYFNSLSEEDQARIFGEYRAQAIRDGGDIYQVINSKRGRQGAFTTEGTTTRGHAGSLLNRNQRRMTPDTIYRLHGDDREGALRVLREQGYILPGGQVPGGSLRGRVEGYGQMGRGGTRRAASQAVEEARRTGVRDPNSRYTMTAAERRLYDAEQRYEMVLRGQNPYSSPGFGNTPDPTGARRSAAAGSSAPLTPAIAAQVESDYRRWLLPGGQVFTS